MLKFIVTEITINPAGPVAHLQEADATLGAKIELYLPKGYDLPEVGAAFTLAPEVAADPLELTHDAAHGSAADAPSATSD